MKTCLSPGLLVASAGLETGGCNCVIYSFLQDSLRCPAVGVPVAPPHFSVVHGVLAFVEWLHFSLHCYWDLVETLQERLAI